MKIEKLPSGSYRIRKTYKGQTYTVIFDCKPTQKEAMQAMAKELNKVREKRTSLSFRDAAQSEVNRLSMEHSPKTVRNYHGFMSAVLGVFYPSLKLFYYPAAKDPE